MEYTYILIPIKGIEFYRKQKEKGDAATRRSRKRLKLLKNIL